MILEVAHLQVKNGYEQEFEHAMRDASFIIAGMKGYISHELQRCMETKGKYLLFVKWETLDDHTIGFRQSPEYQDWRKRLHHFYYSALVEHYDIVDLNP